jgi:short-subunit dehydrogenase
MNRCLITGATGFLGQYLVEALLEQNKELTLLVRQPESAQLKELLKRWECKERKSSIKLLAFDLAEEDLGLDEGERLNQYDHVYHLAAIYDLASSETDVLNANVEGTRRLLTRLCEDKFKGCFHFISSIAVAGNYAGKFDEFMFDEGQSHNHVYHLSKFESEKIVREFKQLERFSVRIYRPSAIVGDSKTGAIDKVDGLYYLFLVVSFLKRWLPSKVPLLLPKTKVVLDVVSVDYVVKSLVCLSLLKESDLPEGLFCFHLSDPSTPSLSEVFDKLLKVSDGPSVGLTVPVDQVSRFVFAKQFKMVRSLQAIHILKKEILRSLNIPADIFKALMPELRFEAKNTLSLLDKHAIMPPKFDAYVEVLWDYYNKNLDPQKHRLTYAKKIFKNKRVLITGGSSGIGFESAKIAYSLGARVILVARDESKLKQCESTIKAQGENLGEIETYSCDLSDLLACDELVRYVESKYGTVDILYSNAGRSIRRSISKSQGRFHDLERTMQLNYFGAARLILGLLPGMLKQGGGQVVHSSSMGTLSATPRFGPYMASKIALDTLMDSMAAEFANQNIIFSVIKFPLVQTPMVAPTAEFKKSKLIAPEQAAMMFVDAVVDQSRLKVPMAGKLLSFASFLSPNIMTQLYSYGFQVWPDSPEEFPEMSFDRTLMKYFIPHSPL